MQWLKNNAPKAQPLLEADKAWYLEVEADPEMAAALQTVKQKFVDMFR